MKKIFRFCFPPREDEDLLSYSLRWEDLRKIHKAVVNGELTKLHRKISSRRWNINEKDQMGRTALHVACALGSKEAAELLLENYCLVNPRDSFKRTPLIKAVQCNNSNCSKLLLERGADPNAMDIHGFTALHYAVHYDHRCLARLLINYKANMEAKDKFGQTPLMLAENNKNLEMVELLTKNEDNINVVEEDERTQHFILAFREDSNENNSQDKDSVDEDTKRNISSRHRQSIFKKLGAKVTRRIDNAGITPSGPGTPYVVYGLGEEPDTSNGNPTGRHRRSIFRKWAAKVTPQIDNAESDTLNYNNYSSLLNPSEIHGSKCHLNKETKEALHTPSSNDGQEGDLIEEKIENKDGTPENSDDSHYCATESSEKEGSTKPATSPVRKDKKAGKFSLKRLRQFTFQKVDTKVTQQIENAGITPTQLTPTRLRTTYPCCGVSYEYDNLSDNHFGSLLSPSEIHERNCHLNEETEEDLHASSSNDRPEGEGIEEKMENIDVTPENSVDNNNCAIESIESVEQEESTKPETSPVGEGGEEDLEDIEANLKIERKLFMEESEDTSEDASLAAEPSIYTERLKYLHLEKMQLLQKVLGQAREEEENKMSLECKIKELNTDIKTHEYREILLCHLESRKRLKEIYMSIGELSFRLSRTFEDHRKKWENRDLLQEVNMKNFEDVSLDASYKEGSCLFFERQKYRNHQRIEMIKKIQRRNRELEIHIRMLHSKLIDCSTLQMLDVYSEILEDHQETRKKLKGMYMSISEYSFKLSRSFEDHLVPWENTDLLIKIFMKYWDDTNVVEYFKAGPFLSKERLFERHQNTLWELRSALQKAKVVEKFKLNFECKIQKYEKRNIDKNTENYSEILKRHQEARKILQDLYLKISELSFKLSRTYEENQKRWENTNLMHKINIKDFEDVSLDASFQEESSLYFENHCQRNQRRIKVLLCTLSACERLENHLMTLQCKITKYNTDKNMEQYTEILEDYEEHRNMLQDAYLFITEYSFKFSRFFEDC